MGRTTPQGGAESAVEEKGKGQEAGGLERRNRGQRAPRQEEEQVLLRLSKAAKVQMLKRTIVPEAACP